MLRKFTSVSVLDNTIILPDDLTRKQANKLANDLKLPEDFLPLPGKILLSTRAISNRTNDNGDFFSKKELLGCYSDRDAHNDEYGYRTFIGCPVFLDHNNTSYDDPRGRILASQIFHDERNKESKIEYIPDTEFEDDDTWVKNYFEVDADRYPLTGAAIKLGYINSTSMGTDIEYSECSICANKARFLSDYCDHISNHKMSKKFSKDDGIESLAYEKNYGLRFFEDSLLTVSPADPTADILEVRAARNEVDLNQVRAEKSPNESDELTRQPDESPTDWLDRRKSIAKAAFSPSIYMRVVKAAEDRPHNEDNEKQNEKDKLDKGQDSGVGKDEEDQADDGPPKSPTAFKDIEGPFTCPAIGIKINPVKCQGCKYNSEAGDLVANRYPEEVTPGGRDPKVYEEEFPSGGMSSTSATKENYKLFTMAANNKVWILSPSGQYAEYGKLGTEGTKKVLEEEVSRSDFLPYAKSIFSKMKNLTKDQDKLSEDSSKQEVSMPIARLADQERQNIVLSQLRRISPKARKAFIAKLSAGDSNTADPRDLPGTHQNVDDKGMVEEQPAPPQNVTPDTNDDGSGVVTPAQVPTVEDKGLQVPTDDQEQKEKAGLASRRVAANQERQWQALELANKRISLGYVGQADQIKEARRIFDTMSLSAIRAQGQAYDQELGRRQASRSDGGRIPVPRPAGGVTRPVSGPPRTPRSAVASNNGSQEDLALQSLAAS